MKSRTLWLVLAATFAVLLSACGGVTPVGPEATPTLEPLSVQLSPAPYPQVIRQNPLPGERLGLFPVLEITFDRPMDTEKTAAAWTFVDASGKSVAGKVAWKDNQTLQFKPDKPLSPEKTYTALIATSAASVSGELIPQAIKLEFRTTNQLAVSQVFPADKTEDVDNQTAITVIFNKPVVPLMTREDQAGLPDPLEIYPAVKGSGEWVSSTVYVFQPESGLNSGTNYQVRVRGALRDVSNSILKGDYIWKFKTLSPQIVDFSLQNERSGVKGRIDNVLLDQIFEITFSQPMDAVSVAAALALQNVETGANFPVKLSWNEEFTRLTVSPVGRLKIASFYKLDLRMTAKAQDGGALRQSFQIKLATIALPGISSAHPKSGKQPDFSPMASVYFKSPMNADSLKGKIKIIPEPKQPVQTYYRAYDHHLDIFGLEPSTEYVIRLQPGMADIYGNPIKDEYIFSFETGGLSPSANLLVPHYPLIYRPEGEKGIFFDYTNVDTVELTLYSLTFDEFSALLKEDSSVHHLNISGRKPLKIWEPTLRAGKDQLGRIKLNLEDEKPLLPGYYYIGLNAEPLEHSTNFLQAAVFVVANENLTLKASREEALAWLVDQESGEPVSGVPVIFYDEKWSMVGKATTDKNGLAHMTEVSSVHYVRTEDEKNLAFASLNWGSSVSPGEFGVWTNYWSPVKNTFAYVYTDRPLYRPGQTVYFKGIVRDNDDLHYSLPALESVYFAIGNSQGQVFSQTVPLEKNGTFAVEFPLGDDAEVGSYGVNIRSTLESENELGWVSFRVAEYVKPEFEVTALAEPEIVLTGEDVKFSLDAAYYSGGGLSNAGVEWFTQSRPYYYQPPSEYGRYSFSDYENYYYSGKPAATPAMEEGQGQTDENGHFELTQTAQLTQENTSRQILFSANVTDVGGNLVGSSTSVTVLSSTLHAGIRPENYVGKRGEAQTFNLIVLDLNGQPVANQTVSVNFAEQRWYSVTRKDKDGVSRWESAVKSIAAGSASAVTDEKGLATVVFTPPSGGQYKATLTARDDQGRLNKASAYLWVSSRDFVSWRQTNDRSFDLIADKDSYDPGDTAKILIAQPFEGENYALITVERGHIYEKKVVKLENNSTVYELPITTDMAPVMYVSVMVVKGAEGETPSDFKMGMARINVNPEQQGITVSIESDKTEAKPGETVTYTVKTKDLNGKPVQADVSLALVDKAVLALSPSNVGPMLEAFYPERGLSIISASSIVLNAEDFNANYQETEPSGEKSGSGGGKGEGDLGIITIRGNFKDTAYWQAQALTDEKGQAQVKVTLPDNMTTWQMAARAVTDDTRVGEATHELPSTRPMYVQLQTPRFFVVDDQAQVGAVVHNNTAKDLSVKVTLTAEGVTLKSESVQTVEVKARQQGYVTWEVVVARDATRADFTATAETKDFADSTRPDTGSLPGQGIPVLAYHVTETVGSSGVLREPGSVTEGVMLPEDLDYLDAQLTVEASPSLAASMTDGLTYLTDYPYLCMEQTVSRFLPNLVSLQALKLAGKSNAGLQVALDDQVRPALQRINSNQNSDGGWGLWPGSESQPTTSAYVILGLVEARQAGYTVSEDVLRNGLEYLDNRMATIATSGKYWEKNRIAFMLYALARGGQPNGNRVSTLYSYRNGMNVYGKAFLMQAMYLADARDERLATLLSEINSAAAKSAAGAWWDEKEVDYWNWNTDVRTTAIVLNALIEVDPENVLIADGVRWLMKHRDGSHWYSTQETSWSLMALTHWLSFSKEFETNYQYAIGLNGDLLENKQADVAHLTETSVLRVDVEQLLADETNYLVLTRGDGPGMLYYSAYMDYSLPVNDIEALDQGILVSRQYFHVEDAKTPISEAKQGDLVQVRVTLVVPESLHYVVIDDPLPAGLEAIDASLLTSQQVPDVYSPRDYDRYGWGWWYFYYKQIYDDKVVMSADYLPAGTYTITYLARASTVGQFNVIPVTAHEFYFPDVAGRSAGSQFVVKP